MAFSSQAELEEEEGREQKAGSPGANLSCSCPLFWSDRWWKHWTRDFTFGCLMGTPRWRALSLATLCYSRDFTVYKGGSVQDTVWADMLAAVQKLSSMCLFLPKQVEKMVALVRGVHWTPSGHTVLYIRRNSSLLSPAPSAPMPYFYLNNESQPADNEAPNFILKSLQAF